MFASHHQDHQNVKAYHNKLTCLPITDVDVLLIFAWLCGDEEEGGSHRSKNMGSDVNAPRAAY